MKPSTISPRAAVLAACLCLAAAGALAQQPAPAAHAAQSAQSAAEWTRGEVRRVDAAAGKLTLRHEEIRNLDMPGMTMVFEARDKALLPGLKAGDTVRFQAADEQGRLVITALERMP